MKSGEHWSTIVGMGDRQEFGSGYSQRDDPFQKADSEEIELAYWLQNSPPRDRGLLDRLVKRYAAQLYRWLGVLLYYRDPSDSLKDKVFSILEKVFSTAIEHPDQFQGTESIFSWLLAICYQTEKQWGSYLVKLNTLNHRGSTKGAEQITPNTLPVEWERLDRLPNKIRQPMILRYLFELQVPEIAIALETRQKEIHQRLAAGRRQLMTGVTPGHADAQLQAFVDGMLDEDGETLEKFRRHLEACEECQESLSRIKSFGKTFTESIQGRWKEPSLSESELNELVGAIVAQINRVDTGWKVQLPVRQAAWVVGLAVMTIGVVFISIRLSNSDKQLVQPAETAAQPLPAVIELPATARFDAIASETPPAPLYIAPAWSSDGNWAVFTASTFNNNTHTMVSRTIDLYDRQKNTIQVINQSPAGDTAWVWWDWAPSISGDGRWIVYVASTDDPQIGGHPCQSIYHYTCMDIILYDRTSGQTTRLTQTPNGGPANGDSLAPTISEDGRWVAFWSYADNLATGVPNTCSDENYPASCLFIYLYDIKTNTMERLPIRTVPGQSVYGVDRISLSADGRYLGFTLSTGTAILDTRFKSVALNFIRSYLYPASTSSSNGAEPVHSSEAIVLDRQTGTFEMENLTPDGQFGNGDSSSPVLSANGQYVAFIANSTNLIAGGSIQHNNVFVRDRLTGQVEIASISSAGEQGNGDSGVTSVEFGGYSLDISSDGRYVAFESNASNLGNSGDPTCSSNISTACNYLYVHDLQTGNTRTIASLMNQDFTLFPGISSDGRWVSYMQYFHNCSSTQLRCSNAMLYDQLTAWITNITKYDQEIPDLQWDYSDQITLPWQTWESTALALSPDGKMVAMGGMDSVVRLWQIPHTGVVDNQVQPTKTFETSGYEAISSIAFSTNGQWIAAGSVNGEVYVWDIASGNLVYRLNNLPDPIKNLVFNKENSQIVVSTTQEAWIWILAGNQVNEVPGFLHTTTSVSGIGISAGSNLIASVRGDGTIWIQNMTDGNLIARLGTQMNSVDSLVFSPDGSMLAARLSDGTIYLWNIFQDAIQAPSITFSSQFKTFGPLGGLVFSSDGRYLASSGMNGLIPVWTSVDGKLYSISPIIPNEMVYSLAFAQNGASLAVGFEDEIVVWGIPQRSDAQFFIQADEGGFNFENPLSMSTASDVARRQDYSENLPRTYFALGSIVGMLKFPLQIPARLPSEFVFSYAMIKSDGSILIRYFRYDERGYEESLDIYEQAMGDGSPPTMMVGANVSVIPVQLVSEAGVVKAEYVKGDWVRMRSYTEPPNGTITGLEHSLWTWNLDSSTIRLRWQQDGVLVGLYYQPHNRYPPAVESSGQASGSRFAISQLDGSDLEQIAAGMIPFESSCATSGCASPLQAAPVP